MKDEIDTSKIDWDFSQLKINNSENFDDYLKELEKKYYSFINKWKERKDYLTEPKILYEALKEYEEISYYYANGGKPLYYYVLKNQQNQDDIEVKAKLAILQDKMTKIGNDLQFFFINVSKIQKSEQKKFLDNDKLSNYKHDLEKSFESAKHILTDEQEKIMNLKSTTSESKWVEMVDRILSKESRKILNENSKIEEKSFAEIMSLINSKNKKVRDSAAKALNEILKNNSGIAEEEINAIFYNKKVDDELRKFSRPDEERHLSDDIDTKVVDSLIESVSNNFDIPKKYYELKAKLLNQKRLEYHERNVPYGKIEKKYSYNEAVKMVYEVFSNLDEEFGEIFKSFVEGGFIDVYPKKGKDSGAFCIKWSKETPTYIMMNYTDKLQDILTLAHECGHGTNNELIRKKQTPINFSTPTSTAEVASTFMEDFVLEKLMKETNDDELKLAIMMMKLNDDISTIFRQVACYKFETELHKEQNTKGFISKEEIGKIFQKNMSDYMGDFVNQSEGCENWWVYWGHIRRFFYVYSYASGLLISKSMQAMVRKDKKTIGKVKEFLSVGTHSSPKDIFAKMNIDITNPKFWNEGINEVRQLLESTEKLAKKIGKIK